MTLKEQILEIREKYPDFVEWLENEYDFAFCPPGVSELTTEQCETLCFGGCKLCWQEYKDNDLKYIKEV